MRSRNVDVWEAVSLNQYLKSRPKIKRITFCLNNDKAGQTNVFSMIEKYEKLGYICENQPPNNNDYNDDLTGLINRVKAKEQERKRLLM